MQIETYDLSLLPFFNPDHEKPFPATVEEFWKKIAQADALLIATPEYNSSITGVLKNAIDWASRAPRQPFNGKPVAMMGASTSNMGTVRAQVHLRIILARLGALPLGKPEVLVSKADQAFDAEGNLVDPIAIGLITELLEALLVWTRLVSPGNQAGA